MSDEFKPSGYLSVSPYLIVRDAEKTPVFLVDVFGAERLRVIPDEGGGILHAEERIDDPVVMMGQMPDGADSNMHVYVADAETTFERARRAGGVVVQPLQRKGDGDYRGGIADGDVAIWWISQQGG